MKSEKEKAEEILEKRRLAAKGLKQRKDGKPLDPLEAITTPAPDPDKPDTPDEKQRKIADRALALGLGLKRR